jgi:septum formation protein
VDESAQAGEMPVELAQRLAMAQSPDSSQAVSGLRCHWLRSGGRLERRRTGKPQTHERAVLQLQQMRGKVVIFHTALAVVCLESGFCQAALAPVKVRFRNLDDAEIENYLRIEQPYDCAGSAKSEGLGIVLLESIESDDPTALVGLPLIRTSGMLRAAGIRLLGAA